MQMVAFGRRNGSRRARWRLNFQLRTFIVSVSNRNKAQAGRTFAAALAALSVIVSISFNRTMASENDTLFRRTRLEKVYCVALTKTKGGPLPLKATCVRQCLLRYTLTRALLFLLLQQQPPRAPLSCLLYSKERRQWQLRRAPRCGSGRQVIVCARDDTRVSQTLRRCRKPYNCSLAFRPREC